MQVWGCMKRVALHQGLQDSSPGVGDCVFFDLARALVYRDAMPIYANLCHIWSIMKHHESLRIIMNLQSLLAVTIMNHCLERSDKSDMFGQATGTTCLCRGWSFISMTLLKKQLLCAATQRIVLGAQLLQFMQLLMLFPGSNAWCLRTQTVGPHRACRWQAAAKLHKSLVSLGAQGAQQESTRCISLCWIEPSLDAVGQRCQS
jgi:hypothetical protein